MAICTLYWECPYCEASNTQLTTNSIPDTPSDALKQSVRNEAKKGVKIHVQTTEDDVHGGNRGEFPDDWCDSLAADCIEISTSDTFGNNESEPRQPSD